MAVELAEDVSEFLEEQVRQGVCADPNELVNDLIRAVREQQRKPFNLTPELESWLLESADQPTIPFSPEDIDGIRRRVRSRTKPSPR